MHPKHMQHKQTTLWILMSSINTISAHRPQFTLYFVAVVVYKTKLWIEIFSVYLDIFFWIINFFNELWLSYYQLRTKKNKILIARSVETRFIFAKVKTKKHKKKLLVAVAILICFKSKILGERERESSDTDRGTTKPT